MLLLSRKLDEAIVCMLPNGEEIIISMEKLGRSQVRVGIDAPREIDIVREELLVDEVT